LKVGLDGYLPGCDIGELVVRELPG
jgi:hypothetical protein